MTTRELIECIEAGTYEKNLESHGVALSEMHHNFFGNPADREEFMRILGRMVKRLKEVEVNGYVAPGLLERSNSCNSVDAGGVQDGPSVSSASKKRKKKKKKKKPAAKESEAQKIEHVVTPPTASIPFSAAKEESVEDFGDPLVTALLGMGFAREQISAAVRACGGTNRATADDLVTWILGQGTDDGAVEQINDTSKIQQPTNRPESFEVNEETSVAREAGDEAMRAAEEENRRKVEASKRLAEKREEQRRRNREWNNREQARQQQQGKLKLAQATAPAAIRVPAVDPPGYDSTFLASNSVAVRDLQTGLPTNVPGAVTLQTGLSAKAPSAPTASVSIAKPPGKDNQKMTLSKKPVQTPHGTVNNPVPVKATLLASSERAFSQSTPATTNQTSARSRAPLVSVPPPMTAQNSFPPIGDDERTVSSFGSNRGLSVSSAPYVLPGIGSPSFAPTGFMQPGPPGVGPHLAGLPLTEEEMDGENVGESSQYREIRATAKEFVPKGYTPPPMPLSSGMPPLLNTFGPALGFSLTSSLPEAPSSVDNSAIPFSPRFLGNAGPPPATNPSFLGVATNGYDRVPTVTPVSEDTSTTTPSIGSSLTYVAALDDSTLSTGLGSLGFGTDEQPAPGNTSSLLSSTFTNGPAIGVESIWGGGLSSESNPSIPALTPLNFGTGSAVDSEGRNGRSFGKDYLTCSWGAPGVNSGGLNGSDGGSIW